VLDLSRILAGPTATQLLGDLGADVVKVESRAKATTPGAGAHPSWPMRMGKPPMRVRTTSAPIETSAPLRWTSAAPKVEAHRLLANDRVDLHDLTKYKFILTHAGSQGLVHQQFARAGLVPRITHELSQLWSILDFVSRGHPIRSRRLREGT